MDSVLRGVVVYAFLLVIFRLAGRRTLGQVTTFDLALLLVIGETTQQALLGDDSSNTNGFLVILTLVGVDVGLSLLKQRSRRLDQWIDDVPLIVVADGRPLMDRMGKARIDETDILQSARELQGLERMDQIQYAVLERSGAISIIPNRAT